jgi:IS5 family transposase
MVKIQEAENRIVIHCEVFDQRPSDSAANETAAKAMGVKRVAVPSRSTKSEKRKQEQKKRWFKKAQQWRTGCEGRISILKRRHGLNRSRYKGTPGMKRWVGLGVMADNMINIGLHLASRR